MSSPFWKQLPFAEMLDSQESEVFAVGLGVVLSVGDAVVGAGTVTVGDGVVGAGGVAVGDEVMGADTITVGADVANLVGGNVVVVAVAVVAIGKGVGDSVGIGNVGIGNVGKHSPISTQHNVQHGQTTSPQSVLISSRGTVRLQSPMGISPTRFIRPNLTAFNEGRATS